MKSPDYYAKSVLKNGRQPTVCEHLQDVERLAAQYGQAIDMAAEAAFAGGFHDVGKYSEDFQRVLTGQLSHVDHAFSSAAMIYKLLKGGVPHNYRAVIEAVCGHHDGLESLDMLSDRFKASLCMPENTQQTACEKARVETRRGKRAALNGKDEYCRAYERWKQERTEKNLPPRRDEYLDELTSMLCTRMLFSCLVDADYTASAMEENPEYRTETENDAFDAEALLARLYAYCDALRRGSTANAALNALRNEVFDQCGRMGDEAEGLFTLTSPTGTGKTLAMLHFALRHCAHTGKKRIIVVLPFLTLTEQNAAEYRKIIPDVLEDHSQSDLQDGDREIASRWSTPFIVTTSVQFFESLFSDKPGDCRKLHSIADSVVLFDEVQSLPAELTEATLKAVNALCERYHTTMVFSTATQPAFDAIPNMRWRPREILPENARYYEALRRTRMEWRLFDAAGNAHPGFSFEEIAGEMRQEHNVCAIVNLRRHARTLFEALKTAGCPEEALFYLTTDLCPAHRTQIIAEIKARQKAGLPCYVVASQCIEAGVDLDFDTLYRTLAPLESIIQAAGRCNRNGRNPEGGRVIVFIPDAEGGKYPGAWYEKSAVKVMEQYNISPLDIHSPADIRRYYAALYKRLKEKKKLTDAIAARDYPGVAGAYRLIAQSGFKVLVPYANKAALFAEIRDEMHKGGVTAKLLQKSAPVTVSTFLSAEELDIYAERMMYPKRGGESEPSDFFVLREQYGALYRADMGLQIEEKGSDGNPCIFL